MAKKDSKPTQKQVKKDSKPKKAKKKNVPVGNAYVLASFNNTIITITDPEGNVLASGSPGVVGFKGTKKSTAFAATKAAQDVAEKVQKFGLQEVKVYISGPGQGRNAAVKGLTSLGIKVTLLSDVTPIPHNGCRPRKMPRK